MRAAARLLFALALAAGAAHASAGVHHEAIDWELRCDNTRTCRAAGYQAEGVDGAVSMRITREAGPATPVGIDLTVPGDEQQQQGRAHQPLRLQVGALVLDGLSGQPAAIPMTLVPELMRALLAESEAAVSGAGPSRTLSLRGLHSVLLKMDEAQGRLDTPAALVRKGTRPETAVPVALPVPVVHAAAALPRRRGDAALAPIILRELDPEAWEVCNSPITGARQLGIHRLTPDTLLVTAPCHNGAYNRADLAWLARDTSPHRPQLLDVNGSFDPRDGSLTLELKGRGLGDCWHIERRQFDGHDFALASETQDGLCRGFAGGAWQLPVFVSRVVRTAKVSSLPNRR